MPDSTRSDIEKGAIALLLPAGAAGYVMHGIMRGDWTGTAAWLPSVLSALMIIGSFAFVRNIDDERLGLVAVSSLIAMHILGGATIALLASIALPDMPTRPALLPLLEWTNPTSLVVFALVDIAVLSFLAARLRKR
ncbi:MAG: hypothetical protein M3R13_01535 [Armatimonadota bacterium]|nr:hypothetical protein [Armatimonadota bacterium]